jgi:hypothetical protein
VEKQTNNLNQLVILWGVDKVFILGERTGFGNMMLEFYAGKTYIVQGEYYPVTTNKKEEAKVYTSKARAENSCNKLINKVGRLFEIVEID